MRRAAIVLFLSASTALAQTSVDVVRVVDQTLAPQAGSECDPTRDGIIAVLQTGAELWCNPSGNGWQARGSRGIYNVNEYGVACDGVTDDTTALQTLLTLANNNGGGRLIFPVGICRLNCTTIVQVGNNTQLDLAGHYQGAAAIQEGTTLQCIAKTSASEGALLKFDNVSGSGIRGGILDDNIAGCTGSCAGTAQATIKISGGNAITIQDVWLANARYAAIWINRAGGGQTPTGVKLIGNTIKTAQTYGLYIQGSNQLQIIGNRIDRITNVGGAAVYFAPTTNWNVHTTVTGNMIYQSFGSGYVVDWTSSTSSRDMVLTGNSVSWSSGSGILIIGANKQDVSITGNNVFNTGGNPSTACIHLQSSNGVTITGNALKGCGDAGSHMPGIYAVSSDYNTISGNSVIDANATGIQLENADYTMVTSNLIEDSGYNGILLYNSTNNVVAGNGIHNSSLKSASTWDGIAVEQDSDYNTFIGNQMRSGTGTPKWGIEFGSGCDNNTYLQNDNWQSGSSGSMGSIAGGNILPIETKPFYIYRSTGLMASDDLVLLWRAARALRVLNVFCYADAPATVMLQHNDGVTTDAMFTSSCNCGNGGTNCSLVDGERNFTADDWLYYETIDPSTATKVVVHVSYVWQ